mgnify:CR=1 FL=1
MKLDHADIRTDEVKQWQGLHLLYFPLSSCSQKVRILLQEKRIPFTPHIINLTKAEQTSNWFLGINPRGVVPVLVDNGEVHIESNDILCHLDREHPSEQLSLLPQNNAEQREADSLLDQEDKIHTHLRVITMQYLAPTKIVRKSAQELKAYRENGDRNDYRQKQVDWWHEFSNNGISTQQLNTAILAFHDAFLALNTRLETRPYLLTNRITVVDISWFISIHRLVLAGYPLHLHPLLNDYYQRLLNRPHFRSEVSAGSPLIRLAGWLTRKIKGLSGTPLATTCKDLTLI